MSQNTYGVRLHRPSQSKLLSKRSIDIVGVLIRHGGMMTGRQIASQLGVEHQNIYRSLELLIDRGIITESFIFKRVYKARPKAYAQNAYANHARHEFERIFGDAYQKSIEKRRSISA